MEQSQEQRKFSRVDFHIVATVKAGDRQLAGTVGNLSLRGMFIETDQQLPIGEEAEINIALSDQPSDQPEEELIIDVSGRVIRVTSKGIAFVFDKIDLDSYVHLKNIIALNTGDVAKIDDEMTIFLDDASSLQQG